MPDVFELFPSAGVERELHGLHLAQDLHSRAGPASTFVYSGFISSIDGRIGVEGISGAPPAIRNDRDWGVFQELMVQADVVVVSGRYVRDVARGSAKNLLPDPSQRDASELISYRVERGLPARPAIAVVTRTGNFDVAAAAGLTDNVIIMHGAQVDPPTVQVWADAGLDSAYVGRDGDVDVDLLIEALSERGLRVVFSAAGPKVLAMLVPALDALYLTLGGHVLGGRSFMTLFDGEALAPSLGFTLESAYLDHQAPRGSDQLFLEFKVVRE